MTDRNVFYIVDNPLRLCVLEPRPGAFRTYEIDHASLSRLIIEAAPHVHKAIVPPFVHAPAEVDEEC
jgi:hypothetical protein